MPDKSHSKSPVPSGIPANKPTKFPGHVKNKKSKSTLISKILKISGTLIVPIILAAAGYYAHLNYYYLPSLVRTRSNLPKVLADDYFYNASETSESFWGTYRSSCYFGMKARSPISPVVGLIWYTQPSMSIIMPSIRHWCAQTDNVKRYGWLEHDGLTFGIQEIEDDDLLLTTSFVKRFSGSHGGDWTMRVEAETTNPAENDTVYSFIVYMAMDPLSEEGKLVPTIKKSKTGEYLAKIDGLHPHLGQFSLSFSAPTNQVSRNFLATDAVDWALIKEACITGTGISHLNGDSPNVYLSLMGYVPRDQPPTTNPRFLAAQITVVGQTKFDIIYESASVQNRQDRLTGQAFDKELQQRRDAFNERFENTFHLRDKMQHDVYVQVGKHALSNMLGSMGYFHGYSKVDSQYVKKPVPYGPLTLFSTVPSRSFFPRGFLWDEGFHQLLLSKWSIEKTLEILGSWLDLMNVEGWIPREVILGSESEARVPAEYIVQHNTVANPPMFFYLIRSLMERRGDNHQSDTVDEALRRFYPRLKAWFAWLNASQAGNMPFTYRWRGRNATTDRELNPKTMASGLDDYPRASHPTDQEYHIDIYCWMAISAKVMEQMAKKFGDTQAVADYEYLSSKLNSEETMDVLHWSQKRGRYSDYGLHTKNVKLERVVQPVDPASVESTPVIQPVMTRVVSAEPKLRLVSDTFGYVSLFPMFLRLIDKDSPKLGVVLNSLTDEDLLWTPYGLRSLAKTSHMYAVRNTEHDPPYWRGSIWVNMNYLALSSLHYYSREAGPHRERAFEVYAQLRNNLVTNLVKEYKRTGFLWEHYDDVTGQGQGSHPFTGWTSLLLLMMSEQYE